MSDKLWKANERATAKRLGCKRMGPQGKSGPDVVGEWLCVESKERRDLPKWLQEAMEQARCGCPETKLPIVQLHLFGRRHDNDYIIMRQADFEAWFGEVVASKKGPGDIAGGDSGGTIIR
jgi:hypothetical protein